jgi:hypothetical protein
MKRQKVFHSQISSLASEHVLIRTTLSHNSGKAQPIFGGAKKLPPFKKMPRESNEYPNPTTLKRPRLSENIEVRIL